MICKYFLKDFYRTFYNFLIGRFGDDSGMHKVTAVAGSYVHADPLSLGGAT